MKKVILSLAIFAATSLSMIAADNNPANNAPNCKAGTECTKPCKGMKAFEGLNLTDAQKTKLQELAKVQQAKKADCCKKDKKDNKDCQKEKLTPEQKQQKKAEMQQKRQEAKQNYLNSIKGILTPEQYTKFLENNFMMSANHHKDMKKGDKHGKAHKDMKGRDGKKGHKDMKGRDSKKGQKS